MFGKKTKSRKPAAVFAKAQPSVISSEMSILGNVISDGLADISGIVDGNVKAESVIVRDGARIRGDIMADAVKIFGNVVGTIKARTVMLAETAHIDGMIMHESLSVEDGATIDGSFKHVERIFLDDRDIGDLTPDADDDKVEFLENLRIVQ